MDRLNSAVELSVEGESLKDCLAKIQGTHGLNYQILRKQEIKIKKVFYKKYIMHLIALMFLKEIEDKENKKLSGWLI